MSLVTPRVDRPRCNLASLDPHPQVGSQVFEDMPQEMRSRLYYVLCSRRDLAAALKVGWRAARAGWREEGAEASRCLWR